MTIIKYLAGSLPVDGALVRHEALHRLAKGPVDLHHALAKLLGSFIEGEAGVDASEQHRGAGANVDQGHVVHSCKNRLEVHKGHWVITHGTRADIIRW